MRRPISQAPDTSARVDSIPGADSRRPAADPTLPLLVAPRTFPIPLCPFDVASTDGFTITVPPACVTVDVEYVMVDAGWTSLSASEVKKTSAAEGAGTLMEHT
jgi:hypothetical protein